ncbi:MAG: nicotinate phosphoribosyltransferase [Verrucomicrobia bacterium]|nr:MAG: nicotinate phosphoribosyltransferase [Verrucomicrobiota bacterium]
MIINSILDNDFYKFTMMHAVWVKYPKAHVTYKFINRSPNDTFTPSFLEKLKIRIQELKNIYLTEEEFKWAHGVSLLPSEFWEYLRNFRYNPDYVECHLNENGQLELQIAGPWHETILFEVPLLALISQTYFENKDAIDLKNYYKRTYEKGLRLSKNNCLFTEFGTRRRRSYDVQKIVIESFMDLPKVGEFQSTYIGTSNLHFSRIYNTPPIGTMAHEWIMGHAGMFGVEGSNAKALDVWLEVFDKKYLIALTDTYTREVFFKEFTEKLAKTYSGIRQDSGDPITFVQEAIDFYTQFNIDPKTKTVVFSDNLTVDRVLDIEKKVNKRFKSIYGIGTHFTNDIPGKRALNIVIKLASINGHSVFKLTDAKDKAIGQRNPQ